jgi:hypothetical protein
MEEMMAKYNGHPNWQQWNVSLWINNDQGLYNMARECVGRAKSRKQAASDMLWWLNDSGIEKTPDGARYSVTSIINAMRGME